MRKLLLLGVAALLLAGSVFAPTAAAQEPGDVTIEEVTLGPGGSVIVTGTIECLEGHAYNVDFTVRQRGAGNTYNTGGSGLSGICEARTTTFTSEPIFSDTPFHGGQAAVTVFGVVCGEFDCDITDQTTEQVRLRR